MSGTEQQQGTDPKEMLRASCGLEADYYVQEMLGEDPLRRVVVKTGGDNVEKDLDPLTDDIAMLVRLGVYPIIVHGGKPQINAELEARAIKPVFHNGKRVTDKETLECVDSGLGQVNKTLVDALAAKGIEAVGITSGVFKASYADKEGLGYVGQVDKVDLEQIKRAIEEGKVPIVSCLGEDETGQILNINGDEAGLAIGDATQTAHFVMISNVPGVLDKSGEVISVINDNQKVEELKDDGTISEGMIPKVDYGMKALSVLPEDSAVYITNAQNFTRELFTHKGSGTLLRHGDAIAHLPSVDAVDQHAVRETIEAALDKRLADDYFDNLPNEAEIFITDRGYRGLAVVLPGKDGEPAYLDKLVVRPEEQGHGIGDELVDKVLEEHPEGAYWRVRKDNPNIDWYRSKGRGQEYDLGDDEWLLFFTKEVKPDERARYAAEAILRSQTALPKQEQNV